MELWAPQIKFSLADGSNTTSPPDGSTPAGETSAPNADVDPEEDENGQRAIPVPTEFKLADLAAAETMPSCVLLNQRATEAFTIMQCSDFSQLPVVDGHGKYKSLISLRSLLEAKANSAEDDEARSLLVQDCLDEIGATSCFPETRLEDAIASLRKNNCLVITDHDQRVHGIVTPYDLANEFATIVAPFKRIEEIEVRLKIRIASAFSPDQLGAALAPSDEEAARRNASDLTFGEIVRMMQNPQSWDQLRFSLEYDQGTIVKHLEWVRDIRNDLMHFREITPGTSRLDNICNVLRKMCSKPL